MDEPSDCKVVIYSKTEKMEFLQSNIENFQSTASVVAYCDIFELNLKSQKIISNLIEPKQEIEIWAGKKGVFVKIMAGYIDEVVAQKKDASGETVQINGRSYTAILTDTRISGKIDFKNGYSEVISLIFKNTPFIEGKVDHGDEKGTLFFRNIAIIEIIKNLSEHNGWVFRMDYDKKYYFTRNLPEKVHQLDSKDILSYKIVKR